MKDNNINTLFKIKKKKELLNNKLNNHNKKINVYVILYFINNFFSNYISTLNYLNHLIKMNLLNVKSYKYTYLN